MSDGYSRRRSLPPEIITDVLSRLPVKSLCRFKCVSPSWNSLISSPYFARTHLNRTNPKNFCHNIILKSKKSKDLYFVDITADEPIATKLHHPSLQPPDWKWVDAFGSCNGLLLFCHNRIDRSNLFLLNPSTRERKQLPPLPFVFNREDGLYSCLSGVGYDSTRDDYKVVMLYYTATISNSESLSDISTWSDRNKTIVAVYSVKTNAWRRIQNTHRILEGTTFGVYFNGCLHWVCWTGSFSIVSFDLADENFRKVQLPASCVESVDYNESVDDDEYNEYDESIDHDITNYELVVVGDCLCLVYKVWGGKIEIWAMEESGDSVSWTKSMVEIMTDGNDTTVLGLLSLSVEKELVLIKRVEIRPWVTVDKLVLYNRQTGTLRDIVVHGIPSLTKFKFWGTYVESLLPCLMEEGLGSKDKFLQG